MLNKNKQQPEQCGIASAFYVGRVWHARFVPKLHSFQYPLYMVALNLDEVEQLSESSWWFSASTWAPLQLKLNDYFSVGGQDQCASTQQLPVGAILKQRALAKAKSLGGEVAGIDEVVMLAQMRCFGIYFSPVNFFFLYKNKCCHYLLAEVSNTPWNEKHYYLVDMQNPEPSQKAFHVSPFMNMDMEYRWKVKSPARSTCIAIENWKNQCLFKAVYVAKRREFCSKNVAKVLLQWPIITLSIVKNIYWQAFRLFLKGIKYVPYSTRRAQ